MAKASPYGVQAINFATPVTGGFPTAWTSFHMKFIVKDSLNFADNAPGETNVEIEDSDDYFASLPSDNGKKGFTVQTYDMSEEAYAFFFGYTTSSSQTVGYYTDTAKTGSAAVYAEPANFTLDPKAVQIVTKSLGTDFPSRVFEWANMKITVSRTGTIGKSGFPNIQIQCTQLLHTDSSGNEVSGARWYNTPA